MTLSMLVRVLSLVLMLLMVMSLVAMLLMVLSSAFELWKVWTKYLSRETL